MNALWNFIVGACLVALIVVVGFMLFLFAFWLFVAFLMMFGIIATAWAFGAPISITENGVKTGHIRWFTFYPVKKPWY